MCLIAVGDCFEQLGVSLYRRLQEGRSMGDKSQAVEAAKLIFDSSLPVSSNCNQRTQKTDFVLSQRQPRFASVDRVP